MSGRHGNGDKCMNWEILGGESRALENGFDVGHEGKGRKGHLWTDPLGEQ